MRQTSFAAMQCSMAHALEVMGDWWSPLVLRDLHLGLRRFDDLAANLGISRNLLAARLKALTEHGVVARERYQDRPARYEYVLTDAGRELVPILMALTAWGDRWATPDGGPPIRFRHTGCGAWFTPTVSCPGCGEPIHGDSVEAAPGPGARTEPGTLLLHRFIGEPGKQGKPGKPGNPIDTG